MGLWNKLKMQVGWFCKTKMPTSTAQFRGHASRRLWREKKNSRVVVITSKFHKTWSISMTVGHDEVAGPTGQ
jgi:hypothetical protein